MNMLIPLKYRKEYLRASFLFPDGEACKMADLSYVYNANGDRFLCVTKVGAYDTYETKFISIYDDNLNQVDSNSQQFFIMVETA